MTSLDSRSSMRTEVLRCALGHSETRVRHWHVPQYSLSSMARNAAQQSQPKGIRCAFAACRNISDVRVSNRHIFVQRYFVHAAIQPTLLFSAGAALPKVSQFCAFLFVGMPKRKRVVLTIEQKVEIVKALKRGESCHSLSEKYGIGISTVSEIGKKAAIILDYSTKLLGDGGNSMRKIMSKSKNEEVMEAVYVWFTQKRGANVPVTGHVLCEKALSFNVKLNGDPDFKASQGWLEKFKKRHGIRSLQMHGEKLSADTSSANSFKEELKMFLEQEQYDEDFVYSAEVVRRTGRM